MVIKSLENDYLIVRLLPLIFIPMCIAMKYYAFCVFIVIAFAAFIKFTKFITDKECILDEEGIEIIWHGFSKKHKWSDIKQVWVWVGTEQKEKNETVSYGRIHISKKPYFLFIQYAFYYVFTPTNIACFYFPTEYALRKGLMRRDSFCNEEELLSHLREWNVPYKYELCRRL